MSNLIEWLKKRNVIVYILGIVFFFCLEHYDGIISDAMLYTLQAVRYLYPDRFVGDIAFMYGNQDSFTIISPIYAFILKLFSIEKGAKIICIISHLLFVFASIMLMDVWTKKFHCNKYLLPLVFVFLYLYCSYGELRASLNDFHYVAPYFAPRIISVAFGLLGLACLFKRKWLSLFLFFVGTIIQPLMAGWGLPLWLFFYYPKMVYPISIISLLFPLTLFLKLGPFDTFDANWRPFYKTIHFLHFASFLMFYAYCWRYTQNKTVKHIARALFWIVSIALYWHVVGIKTEHVFLNMVQTFRIEWLCISTTFPLFCIVFYNLFVNKIRKRRPLCFMDRIVFLFPFLFWVDSILIEVLALIFICWYCSPAKFVVVKKVVPIIHWVCLLELVVICIIQQLQPDLTSKSLYQNYEFYLAGTVAALMLLRYVLNQISMKSCMVTFFVIFVANMFQDDLRFIENSSNGIALLSATIVCVGVLDRCKFAKYIPLVWLVPFAIMHYDCREERQIFGEKQMNRYFEKPLFPEITERGRMLFSTAGYFASYPRLQFLTGAYLDYQSQTGSIFFREQHVSASRRFNMMFYQEDLPVIKGSWNNDFVGLMRDIHSFKKLSETTDFLCEKNEISYLVTDISGLKFTLVNETIDELGRFYLYSCD